MGVLSGEEKWRPDRIGITEAREIRRGRREGPSRRSRRGAEGDCPARSEERRVGKECYELGIK